LSCSTRGPDIVWAAIGVITYLEQLKIGTAIHTIEHLLAMQGHCPIFNILFWEFGVKLLLQPCPFDLYS